MTLPDCDLRIVNDHDLTFAAVRTDKASLDLMLRSAGRLPDAVSRALAVATAYDMLVKGELSSDDALTCVLGVLETETVPGVVEPFLRLASLIAGFYTPVDQMTAQRARVADRAAVIAREQEELQQGALYALASQRDHRRALRPARRGGRGRHRPRLAGGGQPRGPRRLRPRGRRGRSRSATPTPTPP